MNKPLGDRRVIFALNSGESSITQKPDFVHGDVIPAFLLNPGPTSNLTIDQTIDSSSTINNVPSSQATYNYGQSLKPDVSPIVDDESTHDTLPTSKAVYDCVILNKPYITTTVDISSTNTEVPTAKAVYDYGQTVKPSVSTVVNSSSTNSTLPTSKAVYDYGQTIKESTQTPLGIIRPRFLNPHYDCIVGLAVWDKIACMPASCWPFTIQDNNLNTWNTDNIMLRGNFMVDLAYPKVGTTPAQYIARTNFPQRRYIRSLFNIESLDVMTDFNANIDSRSGVYMNGTTLVLRRYKVYPQTIRKFDYTTQNAPTTFGGDFPWDCCVIDAYDFELDLVMRAPHFSPDAYNYPDSCLTFGESGMFNSIYSHIYRNPPGGYTVTPTADVASTDVSPKLHLNIPNFFIGGVPTSVHPSGIALVRLPGFTEYLRFKTSSGVNIPVDSMYDGYYTSTYSKVPVTGTVMSYDRPNNTMREYSLSGYYDPWISWSDYARIRASPNTQLNTTRLYIVNPSDPYGNSSRLFYSSPNNYDPSWSSPSWFTGVGTIIKELRMKWNFVKQ